MMSGHALIQPAYLGFVDDDFLRMLERKKYRVDREIANRIRDKAGSNWRLQKTVDSVSREILDSEDFGRLKRNTDDLIPLYRERACTRIAEAIADYCKEQ